ncbi:MAG: cyclic nucleotide-binding domain-containing protein, partial [Gemmatimonadota bacterium]|nr:cyclic nucleotide-binding domain-containing protein [Gemmatimonadota bacterium]
IQRGEEKRIPLRRQVAQGAGAITSSGSVVILVAIIVAATFTYGEETVLYPLVAERLLSTGAEGVGYLFAAFGVGGVLASGVANRVVERGRPGVVLVLGSLVAATPLLFLPLTTTPAVAYLLVAIEGGSFIFVEVLATTLLQRIVRADMMARVFGIIDSLTVAGTVLGAFVAPVVVRLLGLQAGLWTAGGILIVLTLLCIPRIRVLDNEAARRRQELGPKITLLSDLSIFAAMPRGSLESLAAVTEEESVTSGEIVIEQGAPADDFFVVRSGTLEVLSSGEGGGAQAKIRELGEGDYAGEIGLVERLPRTATVRATSDCSLYRIKGDDFLSAVNGTPALSGALFAGIAGRLARTHPSYQPKGRPPG